ncbi:MAG: InlB B-repeat-containing protein, partial [Clostridia bacterium]|nr:InlB B-repeat-containing protein [Clostridia bacterium]
MMSTEGRKSSRMTRFLALLISVVMLSGAMPYYVQGVVSMKAHAGKTAGECVSWTQFKALSETDLSGKITVSGDSVTLSDNIVWDKGITVETGENAVLDLNGYGILYTGDGHASVLKISGGSLVLRDSGTAGTERYITCVDGRAVSVSDSPSSGAVTVRGGFIAGGTGTIMLEIEHSTEGATIIIHDESVVGCGVYIQSGSLKMEGGTICCNSAGKMGRYRAPLSSRVYEYNKTGGGGVYIEENTSFEMTGGSIKNNYANMYANGVVIEYGENTSFKVKGNVVITDEVYSRRSTVTDSNIKTSPIKVNGRLEDGSAICVDPTYDGIEFAEGDGYVITASDASKFYSVDEADPASMITSEGKLKFYADLDATSITFEPEYRVTTGNPVVPLVYRNGRLLENGRHYTASFRVRNGNGSEPVSEMAEPGIYEITVSGKGSYGGSVVKTFTIYSEGDIPAPTYSVAVSAVNSGGCTFAVSRNITTSRDVVRYRTVGLSALGGSHFNPSSGTIEFGIGEETKTVTVRENPNGSSYQDRFQCGTNRNYRFEVMDMGGFTLCSADRSFAAGTNIPETGVFNTEKSYTVFSSEKEVTDNGYAQAYWPVPATDFFTEAETNQYLALTGAELRMTAEFEAKEESDGYQYIQILANDTENADTGAGDGDPGTVRRSLYMAGFVHLDKSVNTTYYKYSFPVTSAQDGCGAVSKPWSGLGNTLGDLKQQRFRYGSRADDGRILLPVNLKSLGIRFNASGSNNDDWFVKNVRVKITAYEFNRPAANVNSITVSAGLNAKGNTAYISIPYDEIVSISADSANGKRALSTSWGELNYIAGNKTNVLTFAGKITADRGTRLIINSLYGTVSDLSGNTAAAMSPVSRGETVGSSYDYTITYELDGGYGDNPTSYTSDTPTFTLAAPIRDGYTFNGWNGTGMSGLAAEVTIETGSTGNRHYTAYWAPNMYYVGFHANGGTGEMETQEFFYDTAGQLEHADFEAPEGYEFAGWAYTADGEPVLADEAEILNLTAENGITVDLYAVWIIKTYSVTFNTGDEAEAAGITVETAHAAHGTRTDVPERPVWEGHTFLGWYLEGRPYDWSSAVTSDITLDAVWAEGSVPAFRTHTMLLTGQIGVVFYADVPEAYRDINGTYVTFSINGNEVSTEYFDPGFTNNNGYYGFVCFVNSAQMSETIDADLHYGGDGASAGITEDAFSVREYVTYMVDHESLYPEKAVALVKAIADYGHYMTPFLLRYGSGVPDGTLMTIEAYNEDKYTNESITNIQKFMMDQQLYITKTDNDSILSNTSYALLLGSETTIRLKFTSPDPDALVTVTNVDPDEAADR